MNSTELWIALVIILAIIIVVAVMVSKGGNGGAISFGSRLEELERELGEINEDIERHNYLIDLGIQTGTDVSIFQRSLDELRERRMIVIEQIDNL